MYATAFDVNTHSPTCVCRMSLQSAIIGFFLSKLLTITITPQENVVVQTTAVATGTVCHRPGLRATEILRHSSIDAPGSGICRHYPCAGLA